MTAYYNENDPYAAQWLRNLIAAGHIALGEVDDRSIEDVCPDDLKGFTQCHFFAGIGGWSNALRLAGWPDDRPVWTGSCPCQPFSVAGKQRGSEDERHLWPAWFWLIEQCRPPTIFGEQVTAAVAHGWLDLVLSDLEGAVYAVAAADLPACCLGAPHRRQRLWWVADADSRRWLEQWSGRVFDGERAAFRHDADGRGEVRGMGNSDCARLEGWRDDAGKHADEQPSRSSSPWCDIEWISCSDGKARPTQPGLFPLAHGVSSRVGRLRAYGNAIVPQVAAEFINAFMDCAMRPSPG